MPHRLAEKASSLGFELVEKNLTSELAYVVEVERLKGKFGAREEIAPYDLRATMIFRPEDGEWKILHRHADQITATEPAAQHEKAWPRSDMPGTPPASWTGAKAQESRSPGGPRTAGPLYG